MDVMDFFDILIHPKERMPKEVKKANAHEAVKTFAIVGAIVGFFIGLVIAFASGVAGIMTSTPLAGLGILAIIIVPIILAVFLVVGSAISSGLTWLIANLFGGKGTFEQNYYLSSRLLWPSTVAGVLVGIVSTIPILGWLVQFAWILYSIYLTIILISVANKLSMGHAFIAWVLPMLIMLVLIAVLFGFIIAAVIAGISGYAMIN